MSDELKITTRICIAAVLALCVGLGACGLERWNERQMADKGYVWVPQTNSGWQKK